MFTRSSSLKKAKGSSEYCSNGGHYFVCIHYFMLIQHLKRNFKKSDPTSGTLYLAFELMESNLYDLISRNGTIITEAKVRIWFFQVCKGLEYIHNRGIFHRDIKPENILISGNIVKIADLGSCRGTHSKGPYTEYIATRWYRPPEVLLTAGKYSCKMDIWGAGQPLFPGSDSIDQLQRIHRILGTPTESQLRLIVGQKIEQESFSFPTCEGSGIILPPSFNMDCHSLLIYLLTYVPDERLTATQALKHPFFQSIDLKVFSKSTQLIYQTTQHMSYETPKASQVAKLPQLALSSQLNSLHSTSSPPQQVKKEGFNPILPTLIHPTILSKAPLHHSLHPKKPTEFHLPLPELQKPVHLPPSFLRGTDRKSSYYRKAEERKILKQGFR
ncbi:hypothetical protein HMI55_000759 [Coelomomyces lativittatus]|nr:hypothetical protein HMI55_000759 [Coelomomyces lativittatus]